LVLVDSGPKIPSNIVLHLAGYNGVKAPLPALSTGASHTVDPMELVLLLFDHYTVQSVFDSPEYAAIDCLLASTVCKKAVTTLESEFLLKRTFATQSSNEEAFKLLTTLRRHTTTAHEKLSSTRALVNSAVLQLIQGASFREAEDEKTTAAKSLQHQNPNTSTATVSKEADVNNISATFKDLDDRLRDIIAAMNDEIQLVIGSVQLEDAKAMRQQADLTMRLTESTMQQTKIAMRQTKWTVALALLAALYLPMTLVTGIYGMNIKEISEDKGPRWWWCL
jgi:Mg2+ and Co2+ transporter CorA